MCAHKPFLCPPKFGVLGPKKSKSSDDDSDIVSDALSLISVTERQQATFVSKHHVKVMRSHNFHSMHFPQIWYKDSFRVSDVNFNKKIGVTESGYLPW